MAMSLLRRGALCCCLAWLVFCTDAVAQEAPPAGVSATRPANGLDVMEVVKGERRLTFSEVLDPQTWRGVLGQLIVIAISLVPRIVVAVIFVLLFYLVYRAARRLAVGGMNKAHVDSSIRDMLSSLIKWAIMGFGLVIAFNQVGIQITALLTGVSIVGLAIGFAAQETLANFIAGIVIFWDRPFKVGDWVEIDDQFGEVQRITFRSTRLLNLDGEVIIFPNTHMLANKVSNHSAMHLNRVRVPIGIAYKESIDRARQVLLALTERDPRICREPAPTVVVTECAASSVNLELRFWIEDEAVERIIQGEYLEKMKNALDAAGIQIPFPHLQVFLEETAAVAMLAAQRKAG